MAFESVRSMEDILCIHFVRRQTIDVHTAATLVWIVSALERLGQIRWSGCNSPSLWIRLCCLCCVEGPFVRCTASLFFSFFSCTSHTINGFIVHADARLETGETFVISPDLGEVRYGHTDLEGCGDDYFENWRTRFELDWSE
jgi:hypothetical protein